MAGDNFAEAVAGGQGAAQSPAVIAVVVFEPTPSPVEGPLRLAIGMSQRQRIGSQTHAAAPVPHRGRPCFLYPWTGLLPEPT